MKKEYSEPRAEKVEFDYQETVTASDTTTARDGTGKPNCFNSQGGSQEGTYCCPK